MSSDFTVKYTHRQFLLVCSLKDMTLVCFIWFHSVRAAELLLQLHGKFVSLTFTFIFCKITTETESNSCSSNTFNILVVWTDTRVQLTPRTPPLHWWSFSCLGCCSWWSSVPYSRNYHNSATANPEKERRKERKKERKKITQAPFFSWTTLPPLIPILSVTVEQPSPWCSLWFHAFLRALNASSQLHLSIPRVKH